MIASVKRVRPHSAFRQWLKNEIERLKSKDPKQYNLLNFADQTGLSRHIVAAHSRQFDPSLESIMLACEVLAIWKKHPFEAVLREALRYTRHYRKTVERLEITNPEIAKQVDHVLAIEDLSIIDALIEQERSAQKKGETYHQ